MKRIGRMKHRAFKKTINNNKPKCNDFLIRNSDLLFGLCKEFGSAKFGHFCVKKSLLE